MNAEKIIDLLGEAADDDNKKFALLIIFTNLIKENKLDELRQETNKSSAARCRQLNERLFRSIDPHFLARLIAAAKLPENCSKHIYKSISLGILAQFLDYPHLVVDPVLLSKMDIIVGILTLRPISDCESSSSSPLDDVVKKENDLIENLVFDTLRYLYAVAEHSPDYLLGQGQGATSLMNVLLNEIMLKSDPQSLFYTKEVVEADDLADLDRPGREPFLVVACKLFLKLFKADSAPSQRKPLLKSAVMRLLQVTSQRQDEFKFCLIKVLNYLMSSSTDFYHFILFFDDHGAANTADDSLHDQTGLVMFTILSDLFKSAKSLINLKAAAPPADSSNKRLLDLDNKYTNVAFSFLSNFVRFYQFEFIYMKNRQLFYLFIHLLCSQIGFNLKMRSVTSATAEATFDRDKQDPSTLKYLNKMSVYYSLLEEIVIILSTASPFDDNADEDDYELSDGEQAYGSDDDEELDDYGNLYDARGRPASKKLMESKQKEKEQARSKAQKEAADKDQNEPELNDAIRVIVELLQYLVESLNESVDSESYKASFEECMLGVSSMRLLICWMCHETLLEDELVKLLPKLIRFSEFYRQSEPQLVKLPVTRSAAGQAKQEEEEEFNIFKMLLSGVQRVLGDKKEKLASLKEILKASSGMQRSASTALPVSFSSMSISSSSKGRSGGVDQVKVEFEIHELQELIAELDSYRQTCLKHLDHSN